MDSRGLLAGRGSTFNHRILLVKLDIERATELRH